MRFALHIFLQFADVEKIERVRERYDPLHGLIPPHVTLIFPFEAEEQALTAAMARARVVLRNAMPFVLETAMVERRGEYLMLMIERGKAEIIRLHDELYAEAFAAWYAPEYAYEPHITLSRGEHLPVDLQMEKHTCTVQQVVLERIGEEERSEILETIRFEGGYGL